MTTRVLIANIGQRDLAVDYGVLELSHAALAKKLRTADCRPKPKLRKLGGFILENYDAVEAVLDAPILMPALQDLAARNELPGRVVLVGTKQEDKAFLSGDTFRCAEVLCRLLSSRFADGVTFETSAVSGPPNDLNAMLPAYAAVCSDISADRVFALCTGGTPACNMALSLRTIEYFGEGCTVLHVPESGAAPSVLAIGQYIFAQHRRAALERLAMRGDFDAIAADTGYPPPVRTLARAAGARMNFNFKESLSLLHTVNHPAITESLTGLMEEGRRLAAENTREAALADVYWNALLKWRRDECADFLGRVWRLLEGTLQDVVMRIIGHSGSLRDFGNTFSRWSAQQPKTYRDYIINHIARKGSPTPPQFSPTIPVLQCTVNFYLSHDRQALRGAGLAPDRITQLGETMNLLRPLTDWRNASIIAHGFEGLSKSRILAKIGSAGADEALLDGLALLLNCQNINPGADPCLRFADAIIALNKEIYDDHPA